MKTKATIIPDTTVVFSPDVVRMLRDLPDTQRHTVTQAIMAVFILGEDTDPNLNAFDKLIFTMVADTIRRASHRYATAG